MEYIVLLVLFLAIMLVVTLAVANHYQLKLNRQLKLENEYKLLVVKQRYQLEDLQRTNQKLLAENNELREQQVTNQREQVVASLN